MNRFYSGLICNIWQKDWSCIVYKLIVAKYIWQLRSVIPLMCVAESFIITIPKQNVRNTESKNYAKYATTKFGNLTWHLGLLFWFWKKFLNVLNFHFFEIYQNIKWKYYDQFLQNIKDVKSQHIQESDNVHQTQTPTMAFFICLVFDSLFIMHIQKRKEIRLMSVIEYYHDWISIEISYLARVHENCEISTYEWYIVWHFEFNFKFLELDLNLFCD